MANSAPCPQVSDALMRDPNVALVSGKIMIWI